MVSHTSKRPVKRDWEGGVAHCCSSVQPQACGCRHLSSSTSLKNGVILKTTYPTPLTTMSPHNHMDRRDSRHHHGCRQAVRQAGSGRGGEPGGTAADVAAAVSRQRIHRHHQRQGGRSQYLPETVRSLTETLMLAIGFAHEIVRLQG